MSLETRADSRTPPVTETVIFPPEVDIANVGRYQAELRTAIRPGVRVVIADLTLTHFCDSAGLGILIAAWKQARQSGTDLRVATSSPAVLRIMHITGADQVLTICDSISDAMTPRPRAMA